MVPFCGRVYRVRSRVDRFIDEKTGKMMSLKTPAVILEGRLCESHLSKRRMFCPRGLHSWWREVWLERVSEAAIGDADLAPCKTLQLQADRLKRRRTEPDERTANVAPPSKAQMTSLNDRKAIPRIARLSAAADRPTFPRSRV